MDRVELPRLALALIGAVLGLAIGLAGLSVLDQQSASVAATVATFVAVVVALGVGLIPWFIAKDDRNTRAIVISSRIRRDLQSALDAADTVRGGIGYAAETADAERIQLSAKRCLPVVPQTLDETFDKLSALNPADAKIVCRGVMAAIDQYVGVFMLANVPLDEGLLAHRLEIMSENGGVAPLDLEQQANARFGKQMMQFARKAAARAIDAQLRIPPALTVLRNHGAVTPTEFGELFESPIPEVARAVLAGSWPPSVSPDLVSNSEGGNPPRL